MTKYVDLSKSLCCACASHWWCFIGWILLKISWLSNKTLEISGIMIGKTANAYSKYLVIDFYAWLNCFAFGRWWSLIGAIKFQVMINSTSLNLIPWFIRNFVEEKSHKIFLEMSMGSHLANRKWPCYLENWDISGVNDHLVHVWSHLQLPS